MRAQPLCVSMLILVLSCCAAQVFGDETVGEITDVKDSAVTITLDSGKQLSEGDEVEIFVDVPGIGQRAVGTARVKAVLGDFVLAEVVSSSGRIARGHSVRINSSQGQPAGSPDRSDAGTGRTSLFPDVAQAVIPIINFPDPRSTRPEKGRPDGWYVVALVPGPEAERSGLQPGDEILSIDGNENLQAALIEHEPGDVVQLDVERVGRRIQLRVELASIPDSAVFNQFIVQEAERGKAWAQFWRASGAGNPQEWFGWLLIAADNGLAEAQWMVANAYFNGIGVEPNVAEAARWCRRAADQHYAVAQTTMGMMCEMGAGVPQSRQEAIEWYVKAADKDDASAQYFLGRLSVDVPGGEPNYNGAMRWFRKAADQGFPPAMQAIGELYENGWGVNRDPTEARRWYEKAQAAIEQVQQANSAMNRGEASLGAPPPPRRILRSNGRRAGSRSILRFLQRCALREPL